MSRILIIALSDIMSDPRVSRQIRSLSSLHTLSVAGRSGQDISSVEFIPIISRKRTFFQKIRGAFLLKSNQFARYYWGLSDIKDAFKKLAAKKYDLIIANDMETLPLSLHIANGSKVLLDAHEYSPLEYDEQWIWRFFSQKYATEFLCREHIMKVDAMMTVGEGIAKKYAREFNIPQPFVIMNAPYFQDLRPKPCGEHISLIHHGTANPSRKLELMIEMMEYLDERFTLDFMLIDNDSHYLQYLKNKASVHPRIHFIQPVKMQDIPARLNSYDMGLYILPPVNFNSAHALPNKFFEFIQARLAVAIGPSPEMAAQVEKYNCGIVSSEFSPRSLAAALNRLNRVQVEEFKKNAHTASKDLCFESSEKIFLEKISETLGNRTCAT